MKFLIEQQSGKKRKNKDQEHRTHRTSEILENHPAVVGIAEKDLLDVFESGKGILDPAGPHRHLPEHIGDGIDKGQQKKHRYADEPGRNEEHAGQTLAKGQGQAVRPIRTLHAASPPFEIRT